MKPWQWLLLALLVCVALLIPIPEDSPKAREMGNVELRGTIMPEVEND